MDEPVFQGRSHYLVTNCKTVVEVRSQAASRRRPVDLNGMPVICHAVEEASHREKSDFRNILS